MQDDLFPDDAARACATVDWAPTRAAGLARLAAFTPFAGRAYARTRNVDRGPDDRSNVSALSPWIRRRLITETEVLTAVIAQHGASAAEKFVQEVFWRTYWKGWLEARPGVLIRFNADRLALNARLGSDAALRASWEAAVNARTGIACFDAWVKDLREVGWLHNHARMWFASIWIFTLRLPWVLGADFMYKQLLDADPASNTLSWRWVAGLHTRGKHYLARAQNIRENTLGRFNPAGELDESASPLFEDEKVDLPQRFNAPDEGYGKRIALLLHDDDLHAESLPLAADVVGVAALAPVAVGERDGPSARFAFGALHDGVARAAHHFNVSGSVLEAGALAAWAKALGVQDIVTPYAPTGLTAWALDQLRHDMANNGVRLVRIVRPYDARAWPHATAGFFKFREKIPSLLRGLAQT